MTELDARHQQAHPQQALLEQTVREHTDPEAANGDQAGREQALLEQVLASFESSADPRFKQVMQSLVRHLHAFIRETQLSEQEWGAGIDFLRRAGDITSPTRQEFILLSDVLGASMQTITVSNRAVGSATEATVFGPFFTEEAPTIPIGGDIAAGAPGTPCWVSGTVTDTAGNPVPSALVDVWECDEDGLYDVQHDDGRTSARGRLRTAPDGSYGFWGLRPVPYPIPDDGPVGDLLTAAGRSPMRAAHLHFMVQAPQLRTLVTHIFVNGDDHITRDSVFGVRPSLVRMFLDHDAGEANPTSRPLKGPWSSVTFDIVLAPAT